jgi:DNA replication protein DnaC
MCAFAKHLWSTGWDISRISYELLALQIRDSYKPGSSTSELDVIQPLLTAGKLIIEDVGTTVSAGQQETEFSLRTFLVLLDRRLEQSLATFVTSNKSVEELARSFDQRIASRIRQGCEVIQIWGRDKRSENG